MGSVYVLGKDIADRSVYIFSNVPIGNLDTSWRYGIYRTTSLTYHAYILGLFNLLILTIYLYTEKKVKIIKVIPLFTGIIASVSKMAYGGLIFVMLTQIFRQRKWLIPVLLVITISLSAYVYFNGNQDISSLSDVLVKVDLDTKNIRFYSLNKSVEIWKDHPFWGVGPGMFGGMVAFKYDSYINELYNVVKLSYLRSVGGIELFWFQLLSETGIIGTLLFINFIIILFVALWRAREQAMTQEMRNLFSALMAFLGCILIYSMGSGINIAPVLFTYCAFVGIGLGSLNSYLRPKGKEGDGRLIEPVS